MYSHCNYSFFSLDFVKEIISYFSERKKIFWWLESTTIRFWPKLGNRKSWIHLKCIFHYSNIVMSVYCMYCKGRHLSTFHGTVKTVNCHDLMLWVIIYIYICIYLFSLILFYRAPYRLAVNMATLLNLTRNFSQTGLSRSGFTFMKLIVSVLER